MVNDKAAKVVKRRGVEIPLRAEGGIRARTMRRLFKPLCGTVVSNFVVPACKQLVYIYLSAVRYPAIEVVKSVGCILFTPVFVRRAVDRVVHGEGKIGPTERQMVCSLGSFEIGDLTKRKCEFAGKRGDFHQGTPVGAARRTFVFFKNSRGNRGFRGTRLACNSAKVLTKSCRCLRGSRSLPSAARHITIPAARCRTA